MAASRYSGLTGVVLTLVMGGIACATPVRDAPTAPVAAPATPEPSAPQPQPGGTLVFTVARSDGSLHPFRGNSSDIRRHVGLTYETLVSFDYQPDRDWRIDYKIVPWLVESWEQPDDKTYVLRLRRGVKWHDGQEFTVADVTGTFQWITDEKFAPLTTIRKIAALDSPDAYSLKITLREPSLTFLSELADQNFFIVAKAAIDAKLDLIKNPMSTGPYKLDQFEANKEGVWTKNTGYWQPGKPYPDRVRQFFNLDDAASLAAFVAGKSDLLAATDKAQVDVVLKLKPDAKYKFQIGDSTVHLLPRVDRPPFDDLRVRKALHLAVDRQALIKTVALGEGSIDPPLMPGWRTGWAIPQEELLRLPGYRQPKDEDIAEARRLLADAGYPGGVKFKLLYNAQGVVPARVAVGVQPALKAAGLDVELEPLETAVANRRQDQGEFDVTAINTASGGDYGRVDQWYASTGAQNSAGIHDPVLDERINRLNAAPTSAERKRLGLELQRYMLEQLWSVPTIVISAAGLWQPWVKDYVMTNAQVVRPVQPTVSRWWLDQSIMPKDR